jgi:hypothetical protein
MTENNAEFSFALGMPSSTDSRDPGRVTFEVSDRATGLRVLNVEFTADEFLKLLRGMYTTKACWFSPRTWRDRIGMKAVRTTLSVPKEYTPSHVRRDGEKTWTDDTTKADGWAWGVMIGANNAHEKWDEYRLSHTNEGWVCHFVRYEDRGEYVKPSEPTQDSERPTENGVEV